MPSHTLGLLILTLNIAAATDPAVLTICKPEQSYMGIGMQPGTAIGCLHSGLLLVRAPSRGRLGKPMAAMRTIPTPSSIEAAPWTRTAAGSRAYRHMPALKTCRRAPGYAQ